MSPVHSHRITSVDALRGFVMFMMIFVNDLAGAGHILPDWMVHFSSRHQGGSGMTFVDLVFPAFLFIVGMSVPLALGGRLAKGEPVWKVFVHVIVRTASLMLIGILMVHGTPNTRMLGWSGSWWCVLMYLSAIAAFCWIQPRSAQATKSTFWRMLSLCVRLVGLIALFWLAFAFRGANGERIITLAPFSLDAQWYGILGLIAWAYLVVSVVFLVFRGSRTALLGCMVLLLCLFAAERTGMFDDFWLGKIVGIGSTLGSLAAISVAGLLLGSALVSTDLTGLKAHTKFSLWFVAGCAASALLLNGLYGINKDSATPSWCLWACAITAVLWYGFYLLCDVRPTEAVARPLSLAGQNVLLAYLISDLLPSLLEGLHLGGWYGTLSTSVLSAVARSAACGILILIASTALNRIGFRLRL